MTSVSQANPVMMSCIFTQGHAQVIMDLYNSLPTGSKLPSNVKAAFVALWDDEGVLECYRRAFEYQLNDSAP